MYFPDTFTTTGLAEIEILGAAPNEDDWDRAVNMAMAAAKSAAAAIDRHHQAWSRFVQPATVHFSVHPGDEGQKRLFRIEITGVFDAKPPTTVAAEEPEE